MRACNFECLLQFVNNELDLDKQLDIYDHLDRCDICRDAIFQISRDLDKLLFFYGAKGAKHAAVQHRTGMAMSEHAQVSA
jgi:predicted anti-sigma-YlaC factor YlaD